LLVALEVVLVLQSSLGRHVGLRLHGVVGGHATRLARWDLGVVVLGRLDRVVGVDTVGVAGSGLWRVQAGLQVVSDASSQWVGGW
jgi:hypothetical protein